MESQRIVPVSTSLVTISKKNRQKEACGRYGKRKVRISKREVTKLQNGWTRVAEWIKRASKGIL